jgi:hypothetical protein
MGRTKGIAIRIDSDLLSEIENHKLSRNELVTKAIESYLHSTEKTVKTLQKSKQKSAWSEVEEDSDKLNSISTQTAQPENQPEEITTETITDNLYHEIYSTLYNTEISPLKKQIELKDDLINTLQHQNKIMHEDKRFLHDLINKMEEQIPKKQPWFRKKTKK